MNKGLSVQTKKNLRLAAVLLVNFSILLVEIWFLWEAYLSLEYVNPTPAGHTWIGILSVISVILPVLALCNTHEEEVVFSQAMLGMVMLFIVGGVHAVLSDKADKNQRTIDAMEPTYTENTKPWNDQR